ncbi:hypothetical protein KC321_g64 [Hortaea werneckii]|nr:hypothetical protein KC321_g64 [Hortaea werneckii]
MRSFTTTRTLPPVSQHRSPRMSSSYKFAPFQSTTLNESCNVTLEILYTLHALCESQSPLMRITNFLAELLPLSSTDRAFCTPPRPPSITSYG